MDLNWLAQNWVWVIVLVFAALYLLRRSGGRHEMEGMSGHGAGAGHLGRDGASAAGSSSTAVDPVSGKKMDSTHAITTYFRGQVYFFESEETRRRFEASPEEYARNAQGMSPASSETHSHHRHGGCC
jgi:YHS domain-containing protein